jgi:hypothetical protein
MSHIQIAFVILATVSVFCPIGLPAIRITDLDHNEENR